MDNHELLEDYLDGRMTVDQMRSFEARMGRDEALQKEYRLHQDMAKAILDDKANQFRRLLDDAHKHYERREKRPMYFRMAAAIVVLLTVGGLILLFSGRNVTSKDLAEKHYKTYQPFNGVRSATDERSKMITAGFEAYHKADYITAARYFETVLKDAPDNNQIRFYLAIAYMENKNPGEAIRLLQNIVETRDVFYLSQAEWYMGLCYLWLGRKEEAILPFERLSKKEGFYQEQARLILKDINKKL